MALGAKLARLALVWGLTTAMGVATVGVIAASYADAATQTYTTTANLNVRSGPGTNHSVLATLKKGTTVTSTGSATGNWVPIKYNGKNAYVSASYLKASQAAAAPNTSAPSAATATKTTTVNVNMRTQPSLTASVVKVLAKGTKVQTTGKTSGIFSEVIASGVSRWVATQYLVGDSVEPPAAPAPAPEVKPIPAAPAPDPQPETKTVYITATDVNVRADATTASASVAKLSLPTALEATGVTKNGFTQVEYKDVLRWVYSAYLSSEEPEITDLGSTSLNKLGVYGKAAVLKVRAEFPQIKTMHGWRTSSAYSADHPSGRALDIMIPNYKTNKALGDEIAAWVIANANAMNVKYVIWQQRYYNLSSGKWSAMADRGSDTENHMDHVHVSFNA